MLPDRVSNPGPLTYESGALSIALRGPATSLVRNICRNYCGKGEKLLLGSNFSSYPQYFVS